MEFCDLFEKWEIKYNYSLQYFHIIDNEDQKSCFYQGDEAQELLEKYDELGTSDFLDWYYDNGLDLAMNNHTYKEDMGIKAIKENPKLTLGTFKIKEEQP